MRPTDQLGPQAPDSKSRLIILFISFLLLSDVNGNELKTQEKEGLWSEAKREDLTHSKDVESLVLKSESEVLENDTELTLRFELQPLNVKVESRDFYRSWAEKLKSNLSKPPHLHGDHSFYPKNQSKEQLQEEICYVTHELTKIRREFQLTHLKSIQYSLLLIFDKEAVGDWMKADCWVRAFGDETRIHNSNQTATATVEIDDIRLNLTVHVVTEVECVEEKTDLPFGRSNFTVAVRELYKCSRSGFYERVFAPRRKLVYRTIYFPLYLESFLNKSNVQPEPLLEKLTCNLLVFPFASKTPVEMHKKYEAAVLNLKKAGPNLAHVDIMGGYSVMRTKGTAVELVHELHLLRWALDGVVHAFAAANLTLHSVVVHVFLVFPQQAFAEANYTNAVVETFSDRIVNVTSLNNIAIFQQIGYVEVLLDLSATADVEMVKEVTNLTEGNSDDFTSASRVLNMSSIESNARLLDW